MAKLWFGRYPGRRFVRLIIYLLLGGCLLAAVIIYSSTTSAEQQHGQLDRETRILSKKNNIHQKEKANAQMIAESNGRLHFASIKKFRPGGFVDNNDRKPAFSVEVKLQPIKPYRGAPYNGAYQADKSQGGVYVNHYQNDEIEIEKELRQDLWPQTKNHQNSLAKFSAMYELKQRNDEVDVDAAEVTNRLYADSIGQIGSQLFQYASLYAISRETGKEPYLSHRSMLPNIFQGITVSRGFDPKVRIYVEDGPGVYTPSLYKSHKGDVAICCYMQSWRYFRKYATDLRNHLQFPDQLFSKAQKTLHKKLQDFILNLPDNSTGIENSGLKTKADYVQTDGLNVLNLMVNNQAYSLTPIGVHIHRLGLSKKRMLQGYNRAPPEYLRKAMDFFREHHRNAVFIVLGDDVRWCRANISLYANGTNDVLVSGYNAASLDLAMMSMMRHNVITTGAFGWWGAWMSEGNVVYYPDWITPGTEVTKMYNLRDYYPPWWIEISVKNETT